MVSALGKVACHHLPRLSYPVPGNQGRHGGRSCVGARLLGDFHALNRRLNTGWFMFAHGSPATSYGGLCPLFLSSTACVKTREIKPSSRSHFGCILSLNMQHNKLRKRIINLDAFVGLLSRPYRDKNLIDGELLLSLLYLLQTALAPVALERVGGRTRQTSVEMPVDKQAGINWDNGGCR